MEAVMRQIRRWTDKTALRQLVLVLTAAGLAFLLSGIVFEERIAPFGLALAAGAPAFCLLPTCLGAAAGAFVFCEPMVTLKYVGAAALIFLLRLTLPRLFPQTRALLLQPAICFFSVFLCAGVVGFADAPGTETALLSLCEGALAGACAAFWRRVFVLLPGGRRLLVAAAGDSAALFFAGAMLLLAFDRFSFKDVSPARIAAYFCVMLLGLCAGESAGGVAGICGGLVLGFAPPHTFLAFSLPAAGVFCGVTAPAGKPAVAAAFGLCALLFLFLKGEPGAALPSLIETGAAILLFMALPKKAISFSELFLRPLSKRSGQEEAGRLLGLHLRRKAGAVREISAALAAVERVYKKTQAVGEDPIPAQVRGEVCADCEKRPFCWDATRILTDRAFGEAAAALRGNGRLIPELLPERLTAACTAPNRLCECFTRKYCEETARAAVKSEVREAKSAAAAQFRQISSLLDDAAKAAEETLSPDPDLSEIRFAFGFGGCGRPPYA